MEKNLKKNKYIYVSVYINESLCYIPKTNTTLQINYPSIKIIKKAITINTWIH